MSGHKCRARQVGDQWRGVCSCRQRGDLVEHEWQADDWVRQHRALIERVKSHLSGQPSLPNALKQYRKAEQDTKYTEKQRALWKQMADELEARLNAREADQPNLW